MSEDDFFLLIFCFAIAVFIGGMAMVGIVKLSEIISGKDSSKHD